MKQPQMTDEVWLSALLLRKRQAAVAEDSCTAQVAITINYIPFPVSSIPDIPQHRDPGCSARSLSATLQ